MPADPTVLLVNHTEAQRCLLRRTLQAAGFQVQEAVNGAQALQLAHLQPDLILLDGVLPDMDGLQVCRRLKCNPQLAPIPVIHISAARVNPQHEPEGLEPGADDYVVQPISDDELIARLKIWLRVRRAEAGLRARDAELEAALGILHGRDLDCSRLFGIALPESAQAAPPPAREHDRQLATVLAALPVAVYIADADGNLLQANPAAAKLWGTDMPLVAAAQFHPYLGWAADTGEPLQPGDWALSRAVHRGEAVVDQEVDIETFDGARKTILASALPVRSADGRIAGGVAVNVDITHRKRMERDLSEAKELVETRLAQFHATINSMTEGVCFFDAQGEAALVNDAFFRIYGFGPECLPESSRKMRSLLSAYDLDGHFVPHSEWPVFAALRGEVVRHRELRVRRIDNAREVIVRHNAAPVRDSSGKPVMAVVTLEDVTAMKQAEEALVRSEKLASVGRMAATVAHEINNPLAAVMNTLFLARGAVDSSESVRRYLELADAELKRIAHITRQALGFYRESTRPADTSVCAVLDSAVDLLKSKIKSKHVKIEKQYQDTPPVTAIPGELRQVFSNLLANSLDAVDDNAIIKLRVSCSRLGCNGRRCVRVTVADNGRGIGASTLPHIFEPFFTTKESIGTGLGLWVSKQIVEKHGGSVRVHSRTDSRRRGTAFSVFLPVAAATQLTAASA